MRVVNRSGLTYGYPIWQRDPDAFAMTVVVKAALDLVPGGPAALPDGEPEPPAADAFYPDDEDGAGPPRYEYDSAPFKPRADVLVVGTCHTPDGRPATTCPASIRVGPVAKKVRVHGPRRWEGGFPFRKISDPEPFTSCAIRWTEAYGGPGFDANPVGLGHGKRKEAEIADLLPRIEDPGEPIRSRRDRPRPAGFAPIARAWPPRAGGGGTYDARWLETTWPGPPEDFDWGWYNAAPPGQQVEGYLRGDEPFRFENLHPEHAVLEGALPGWRVRAFLDRETDADAPVRLEELPLHLDTFWADLDDGRIVLLWRGVADVADERLLDVRYLYLAREPLAAPRPAAEHAAALEAALRAEGEESDVAEDATPEGDAEESLTADEEIARAEAQIAKEFTDAGAEPAPVPEGPDEAARAEEAALLAGLGVDAGPPPRLDRDAVAAAAAAGESLAGRDLRGLDLSRLSLAGAELTGARLDGSSLEGADLTGAKLAGASLAGARGRGAILRDADLAGADLTAADLAEADLAEASLVEALAEDAALAGARLGAADLTGTELVRADLSGADLSGATLTGADLTAARLDNARFVAADLSEATLEEAHGEAVDLSAARLDGLRAGAGVRLPGAILRGAVGAGTSWEGAGLAAADLRYAVLHAADFGEADLEGADLRCADLREATLLRARLCDAKLGEANLFAGSLERADLTGADLTGSNLYGAETLGADLTRARLDGANRKATKLEGLR